MTKDVEKRWNDPPAFRDAAKYVIAVVVLALVWLLAFLLIDPDSIIWSIGVTAILLCGGIGAFIQAYRVYKRGGTWPVWQGAGWILFALMLATLGLAAV